jgi:hypothetical protein
VTVRRTGRPHLCLLVALSMTACRPSASSQAAAAAPLPAIPVYEIRPTVGSSNVVVARVPDADPIAALGATRRVSLNASDAEVRTLLLWLAQEAGVSLVVSPDVTARVSVNFNDIPAGEAMRALLAEAGLSVLSSRLRARWPPVIFHQLPVNINEATVEGILARFGVSAEMAQWIVESRPSSIP